MFSLIWYARSKFIFKTAVQFFFFGFGLLCISIYLLLSCFFLLFYSNQSSQLNFNKIRRNLLKIRSGTIPKPPLNVEEVIEVYKNEEVIENYSKTKHQNKEFLFFKDAYDCGEFSYCFFLSDHVIENIKKNIPQDQRRYMMDATFKICPMGTFYQLLVIYVDYCQQVCE